MYQISFPNIGIHLKYVPDSFQIFGIQVRLYGLIIALGFLIALAIVSKEAKRTGQNPELYLDYLLYGIIPSIVCARLYYVIFSWDYYFVPGAGIGETLLKIVNIRQGGLAIYGGLIGGVLVCYLLAKKRKVSFLTMVDTIVLGVPFAQMLGRWGNFFNREAFGTYTDSLFAMAIPTDYYTQNGTWTSLCSAGIITDEMQNHIVDGCIWVHPTFLYESLWSLALFIFLLIWRKRTSFKGELMSLYVAGYGLGRFWIEGMRTDPLTIGNTPLRVSQLLAACLVVGGLVFFIVNKIRAGKSVSAEVGNKGQTGSQTQNIDN